MPACSAHREAGEDEKSTNKKQKTLIWSNRAGTSSRLPPSAPPLFTSPLRFSLRPPASLPLRGSRGGGMELAVVTRLMDDSESGIETGGRWRGGEGRAHQVPCNHFMDMCYSKSTQTSTCPPKLLHTPRLRAATLDLLMQNVRYYLADNHSEHEVNNLRRF